MRRYDRFFVKKPFLRYAILRENQQQLKKEFGWLKIKKNAERDCRVFNKSELEFR